MPGPQFGLTFIMDGEKDRQKSMTSFPCHGGRLAFTLWQRGLRDMVAWLPAGRGLAYQLARIGKEWRAAAAVRMPEARGDIREIVGQPVFVPLQKLAMIYGKVGSGTGLLHAPSAEPDGSSRTVLQLLNRFYLALQASGLCGTTLVVEVERQCIGEQAAESHFKGFGTW